LSVGATSAHHLSHRDLDFVHDATLDVQMVGWDSQGPIGAMGPYWTQNFDFGDTIFGTSVQLDALSRVRGTIGGNGCHAWAINTNTSQALCGFDSREMTPASAVVRTFGGQGIWNVDAAADAQSSYLTLSPRSNAAAFVDSADHPMLRLRSPEQRVSLPAHFLPIGWLDDHTIIGWNRSTDISAHTLAIWWIDITAPAVEHDLRIDGVYLGALT